MNTDPDGLVRLLWRLRERLNSPCSSVPYEVSGAVWATLCVSCGAAKHHRSDKGIERCSRCGAQWTEVESRVPRTQRTAGNPMERAYHELGRCVSILAEVPEPGRTLYEHHLSPFGGGREYAIDAARKLGVLDSITTYAYWSAIRQAREIVGLRLAIAEPLSGRVA